MEHPDTTTLTLSDAAGRVLRRVRAAFRWPSRGPLDRESAENPSPGVATTAVQTFFETQTTGIPPTIGSPKIKRIKMGFSTKPRNATEAASRIPAPEVLDADVLREHPRNPPAVSASALHLDHDVRIRDSTPGHTRHPVSSRADISHYRTKSRPINLKLPRKAVLRSKKAPGAFRLIQSKVLVWSFGRSISSRVAMTRRKCQYGEAAYLREKRLLAKAADIDEDHLAWIGLFRLVPLAAAESIEVDERQGILSLVLKPDAAAILKRARTRLVNMAMARDKRTGAIVQTLIS